MSTLTTTSPGPDGASSSGRKSGQKAPQGAFSAGQLIAGIPGALRKLNPKDMWHNPVMFIVEIGAALTTLLAIAQPFLGPLAADPSLRGVMTSLLVPLSGVESGAAKLADIDKLMKALSDTTQAAADGAPAVPTSVP